MSTILANLNIHLIEFSSFLVIYFGFIQLIKRGPKNYVLVMVVTLSGLIHLRYSFFLQNGFEEFPHIFFFHISMVLLVGPLILRLGVAMADAALQKTYKLKWHLLPAAVGVLSEVIIFMRPAAELKSLLARPFLGTEIQTMHLAAILASIHITVYSSYLLYLYIQIHKKYELNDLRLTWVILIAPLPANLLIGIGFISQIDLLFHLGTLFISLICLMFFVFTTRYQNFFDMMLSEIKSQRYKNTPLDSIDQQQIQQRLLDLMQGEHWYRDQDLRVAELASELKLTTHQLSRILNESYGKNFNEYINSFRIDEAKDLLKEKQQMTVLDIAYAVGFNSKSTFNAQFQRIMGQTPMEYRKQN